MKQLILSILLFSLCWVQAQLTYKKHAPSPIPLKAALSIQHIREGMEPALVREAPAPMRKSPRLNQQNIPNQSNAETTFQSAQTSDVPVVVKSFVGQGYQFSAPNDNHLAVGANGKIISVVNTNMTVYDTSGAVLFSSSLSNFADTLGVLGYTFDPRAIYDPQADRFIVTFLNGFLDSTSQIIIAFSQTNNPEGDWNFYLLNGNPLNNSTWSDYPAIGLNQQELFLTYNTFTNGSANNSGYTESTIWQIDKNNGYSGQALTSDYYYDLKWAGDTLFNTTPVCGGVTLYGPNMYFLNSNPFSTAGTDSIYVLEITNTLASGTATLQATSIQMGLNYYEPLEAKQKNNHTLITNDSRVQAAILENDALHFVLNSVDQATQRPMVYYGRVTNFSGTRVATGTILMDTLDLAYGSIGHLADPLQPYAVVVGCLHSSNTTNAGHSAFYLDNDGLISARSLVKSGGGILNVLSGTSERWGDYTGCVAQPGEPGSVWYAGSYSSPNARNMTWISKIRVGQFIAGTDSEMNPMQELSLFPVPAQERISVRFELAEGKLLEILLLDGQGKLIRTIARDYTRAGKIELSIRTDSIPAGVYFLQIKDESGSNLANRKFIVTP